MRKPRGGWLSRLARILLELNRFQKRRVPVTYNEDARRDAPGPSAEGAPCPSSRPPVSRPFPAAVEPWSFCLPDRPAPVGAGDSAWLVFLGVEPQEEAMSAEPTSAEPWVDFFRP